MVVITSPLEDVLFPNPHVGQARSLIMSGATTPVMSGACRCQTAPTEKFSPWTSGTGGGFHVERPPGGKVMIGLVRMGPIVVHSSRTASVPST